MKRFNPIILSVFIIFGTACYKDTGNYHYKNINEITISGLAPTYSAILGLDVVHIDPQVKNTENITDPDRLIYYWILYRGGTPVDTPGRARVLDYKVSASPDSYILMLRIIDKETGVAWKASTTLNIGTRFSTGIMLMGTGESGNAEVDMITMVSDTIVIHGILGNSGLPALHDPVTILHNGNKDTSSNWGRLWVMTNSGSYYLDRKSMQGSTAKNFGSIVWLTDNLNKQSLTPVFYAPQIRDKTGTTGNTYIRAMITSDGNFFPSHTYLTGGDYYQNPANREQNNYSKLLKAAPFLWYPINSINSAIWYDTDNQRFMNYVNFGINTYSLVLTDNPGDVFPWDQASVGRTLVYGENTRNTDGGSTNGNSFAIVKDNSNQCAIYKFYVNGTTPAKRDLYTVLPVATDFAKASFYAFSGRRSVIFYAVGNTLYAYDYNKGYEKAYQFPDIGSDEITMLKFDTEIDYATNSLYIATYNSAGKGRLRRFLVGTDPNTVTISAVPWADWNGLIKIKDMNWRAFN